MKQAIEKRLSAVNGNQERKTEKERKKRKNEREKI